MIALSLYCERVAPGLLGEPLNALSNAAFLWAATSIWRHAGPQRDQRALAALLAAIGFGSLAFHSLATVTAQLCDVIPIALFQFTYLHLYLRRIARLSPHMSGAWLALYGLLLALASQASTWLNGSLAYAPAAGALLCLAGLHHRLRRRWTLLIVALLFVVSLGARTIDRMLCAQWQYGTHFLWHVLNAFVLYRLCVIYRDGSDRA